MMYDNEDTEAKKKQELQVENNRKNLMAKLAIDFANIKRVDRIIARELEKRFAFSEDCVKILFMDKSRGEDKKNASARSDKQSQEQEDKAVASLLRELFDIEELNYDPFFISENVIKENIFPCTYVFRCIDTAHRLIEYMNWHSEMQNKRTVGFLQDVFGFEDYRRKTANLKIGLNERIPFGKFMSYIILCDFKVIKLDYDGEEYRLNLVLDIQNKSYLFNVFIGLIKLCGAETEIL